MDGSLNTTALSAVSDGKLQDNLNNRIPFMVRPFGKLRAHHEWKRKLAVRPELVEGRIQSGLNLFCALRPGR